jgi:hypothetical protein
MLVCRSCDVELTDDNWNPSWKKLGKIRCKDCNNPNRLVKNAIGNPERMYVNSNYIKKDHPLYKAGSYKSFNDAAFSSLKNYEGTKKGDVYVVTNSAWPDWVKIGMAIDSEDRLVSYQTSSPHRDFTLEYTAPFDDRRKAETEAHKRARLISEEHKGEWFKINKESAIDIISSLN